MEMSLLYHHANSAALLIQQRPDRIPTLTNLLQILRRNKRYGAKTLDEWVSLDWDVRLQHLRELSFSNLRSASGLFDDIYGSGCFDNAWGSKTHAKLAAQYEEYQNMRNGILHRGGEISSGANIPANERDIEKTFKDSQLFRDAILALSRWCYEWWRNFCLHG